MALLLQLRSAKERASREGILRVAFDEALVSFDRTFCVAFFFRGLSNLKQLRCITAYLLVPRCDELGLFTWLKDHGSHTGVG